MVFTFVLFALFDDSSAIQEGTSQQDKARLSSKAG